MDVRAQTDQIADHLMQGRTLTPLGALQLYGCMRLGARIYDLKSRGYVIKTTMVTNDAGKRYAQYSMTPSARKAQAERNRR